MTALWWWISGFGTLGIAGLVLAFFFANGVFWMILKGLAWFYRTRLGFGIVVGAAMFWGATTYQHHIDTKAFAAEKAAFKAAQAQRDKDIHQDAKVFALKQIADEYMAQQDSDYEVAQFKAALKPAGKCLIGDDAGWLRDIANGRRPQGRDHNRVREAPAQKAHP